MLMGLPFVFCWHYICLLLLALLFDLGALAGIESVDDAVAHNDPVLAKVVGFNWVHRQSFSILC